MKTLDQGLHKLATPQTRPRRRAAFRLLSILTALLSIGLSQVARSAAQESPSGAEQLEVRIVPDHYLIANRARTVGLGYEGSSPYYDLVLQAIYFINRGTTPLTLEEVEVELLTGEHPIQTTSVAKEEIQRTQAKAAAISGMNLPIALEIYYSAATALPEGVSFSSDLTLGPNTTGLVDDVYLVVRSLPDQVRVTATARTESGETIKGTASLPIREHQPANAYIFPVEPGEWFILSFPGLKGHHRWTAATEHGLDITMVDSRGSWARGDAAAWRTGRVPEWEDWYAYGKKVLAAADGTVIKVVDDVEFPLDFWNRGESESQEDYQARIGRKQMELFMEPDADPMAVAGGNYIVIEHQGGEYSHYAHLAHGTIRVEEGDRVSQGQHIAGLGGTGEVPAVHLHFQISDRPSMMGARTLPVQFSNVTVNEQFVDAYAPETVFQPGFFINNLE